MKRFLKTIVAVVLIAFSLHSFAQVKKTEAELSSYITDSLTTDGVIQSAKFLQLMRDFNTSKEDSTWIDSFVNGLGYVSTIANTTELNILDGALVSTAELNYSVGVTSNIQDQLDAKKDSLEIDAMIKALGYLPKSAFQDSLNAYLSSDTYYNTTEVDSLLALQSGSGTTDSIRVLSSAPSTGNVYIDSISGDLKWKVNNYWYAATKADSVSTVVFDASYQQIYDSMTVKPGSAIAGYQNDFVVAAKANGYWSKLDILYVFAQSSNDNGEALFNWKDPTSFKATNNGATFTALEGFTGNGSSYYLSTNYDPLNDAVNFTVNGASIGSYTRLDLNEAGTSIGTGYAGRYADLRPRSSGTMWARINSGSGGFVSQAVANSLGMAVAVRTSSSNITLYKNGTSLGDNSSTSTEIAAGDLYVLLNNSQSNYSTNQVAMVFAGAALTAQEVSDLNTDFEAYMDAIGKGVE